MINSHNIQAIVTDLDGTLLNDNRQIGKEDIRTLKFLGDQGISRIVATGRSMYSFHDALPKDFPIDWLIFTNGSGILNYKTKEIISNKFIPRDQVIKIAKKLTELQIDFQVRNPIPKDHGYFYRRFYDENPDFDRLAHIYKDHIRFLKKLDQLGNATRVITISQNHSIIDQIEREFSDFQIIRATSPIDGNSVWMEIYPPAVNKGSALLYLCNYLNISMENTIGLGNDYNDLDFLKIVRHCFVTANAAIPLKNKCRVTVNNNQNPLTHVLREIAPDVLFEKEF